jgi:hypothetical protein
VGRFYWYSIEIVISDSIMLKTMLGLGFFAVCMCWAIGAYNRMVRLRAAASESRVLWQTTSEVLQNLMQIQNESELNMPIEQREIVLQSQVKLQLAKDAYISATALYNQAIKQFPASLLAASFAFKPLVHNDEKST